MLEKVFDLENGVWCYITKLGQMVLLSVITIALTLPIVTAPGAWMALYYAVVVNIRGERGYTLSVYWKSFRQNFFIGIKMAAVALAACFIAYLWYQMSVNYAGGWIGTALFCIAAAIMLLLLCVWVWMIPYTSKFETSVSNALLYSLFFTARHLCHTVLLLVLGAIAVELVMRFPVLLLVLPSLLILLDSYIIEKIFCGYIEANV